VHARLVLVIKPNSNSGPDARADAMAASMPIFDPMRTSRTLWNYERETSSCWQTRWMGIETSAALAH
jgi:hypothetical protein